MWLLNVGFLLAGGLSESIDAYTFVGFPHVQLYLHGSSLLGFEGCFSLLVIAKFGRVGILEIDVVFLVIAFLGLLGEVDQFKRLVSLRIEDGEGTFAPLATQVPRFNLHNFKIFILITGSL
jgi:hypothetical protein